jgi:peptide/nickel transport system substrate-binding protein
MNKNTTFLLVLAAIMVSPLFMGFATAQTSTTLIFGTTSDPVDLDCHQMWDSASIDVADQVCEGLFAYDLRDSELKIVQRLAADDGVWSADAKVFNVTLKQNVWFHDGTKFNATAVKWNFDRLMHFIETGDSQIAELYEPLNGELVINETVVVSEFVVSFKLNYAYVPFKALLCFSGSYIMSPSSTPEDRFLEVGKDVLVGTGPYVYSNYVSGESLTFDFWPYYYGGTPAIRKIIFQVFADDVAMNQALLSRNIQMVAAPNPDFYKEFEKTDNHVNLSQGPARQIIQYIGMNNKAINQTFRQAISYAFNYSYVIDELMLGRVTRLKSPVPNGILYANDSFNVATQNITKARQVLINAGLAPQAELNNDTYWTTLAEGPNPIATFNYTFNTGNTRRQAFGSLIVNNTKAIGIKVESTGIVWADFLNYLYGTGGKSQDQLGMYAIGWAPDYNDPSNFINPLFSNTSTSNSAQVNDPQLQAWMMEALTETNSTKREKLYDDMQKRVVEELMPWIFLYVGQGWDAWDDSLVAFPQNAMGKFWWFDCTYNGVAYNSSISNTGVPPLNLKNQPAASGGIPGFETSLVLITALGATALLIKKYRK